MSSDLAINVEGVSKCYHIYDNPRDRLKQMFSALLPVMLPVMLTKGRRPYFREFWAVNDVSFSIKRGETVGIIGRNGSGKSTLLQMICGTVFPTCGTINTRGRIAALLELGAGFNMEFTGRENVFLNAAILGIPKAAIESKLDDIWAFSELGEFLDQPVKTYSSGMYARLAFSIAIHVDPDILIVDEALAVGDSRFVAKCMRRIQHIKESGATILFVSHDVGTIRSLCTRAIWLNNGCLVSDGDVFPVTGKYMEFLFRDDDRQNGPVGQISNEQPVAAIPGHNDPKLDPRPVAHWGSHKGLILSAAVCNEDRVRSDLHAWGKPINVVIEVSVPVTISREHLSIAISIKDLKGTDFIVSTTCDFDHKLLPKQERFNVIFSLPNFLVTGKYLLVAAIENRHGKDIHYYEYLEGAHYFSSDAKQRFFGIMQPPITQQIIVT